MRILLIAFVFISCNDFSKNYFNTEKSNSTVSGEKIDTAHTTVYAVTAKPDLFETAFFPIAKVNDDERVAFSRIFTGQGSMAPPKSLNYLANQVIKMKISAFLGLWLLAGMN